MRASHYWKLSLTIALCHLTSLVDADELESRVLSLQTKMAAVKMETVKKTAGVQFAQGGPQYDGYGLFVSADLLFWHLNQGGADYSLSHKGPLDTGNHKTTRKVSTAHFNWDFGFRAGAGYTFEHDSWDALLNYTWFQTDASDTAHKPKHGGLSPQKGFPLTVNAARIHCDWNVHYNVLDLELGKRFFISRFLVLRPQMGIESAWIWQRRSFAIHAPHTHIHDKNSFWGIGPRAGVDSTWYFGRHFSAHAAISGSLQWGTFEVDTKETMAKASKKKQPISVDGDIHTLVPNAQMKLGLGWDANINENKNHLGIRLSYEFQYWWRQNQFLHAPFKTVSFQHESRDLSINGLTLDVGFDF